VELQCDIASEHCLQGFLGTLLDSFQGPSTAASENEFLVALGKDDQVLVYDHSFVGYSPEDSVDLLHGMGNFPVRRAIYLFANHLLDLL